MLSLSDSTFSSGGDGEGSVAANSVMPALADGDRGVWCLNSHPYCMVIGLKRHDDNGRDRLELGAPPPPSHPHLLNIIITSCDASADRGCSPSLVHRSSSSERLNGISMVRDNNM
ncbi:hypothetical protein Tco_1540509 [Tanacetum coccineum]